MRSRLVRRAGMTLVELLVVVAILGVLAVAVLPNVSNTAESRRNREAARVVSSFVAKAHSRAIGRQQPSGFMFVATGTASFAAMDLWMADVPPPYRGDTSDATITMAGTGTTQRVGTASASALGNVQVIGVTTFDLIRFGGRGPFFELVAPPTQAAGVTIRMLGYEDANQSPDDLGYTARNTPWPAPAPQALPFEIHLRPRPAGSPLSIPDGRVIDIYWSGYGPPNVGTVGGTYRQFTAPGSSVSVVFDGAGRIRQVVESSSAGTFRRAVTGTLFLLIGRADRAGQALSALNPADDSVGANWQYPDSWWVAIDQLTGVAKVAECRPGATSVLASQEWIRSALLASGR